VEKYQPVFNDAARGVRHSACLGIIDEWRKQHPPGRFVKAWGGAWNIATDEEAVAWISAVLASTHTSMELEVRATIDSTADSARRYFNDLMTAKLEDVPAFPGMSVIKNLHNLETKTSKDLVVRSITEKFWQACIDVVDQTHMDVGVANDPRKNDHPRRVVAVGTPGVGKSTSTPILIRMLLKAGKAVVYLIRELKNEGWYYEVTPRNGQCDVNV
jgi:signal recognition particle GTPase